ncbi:MAG: hypothetical protein COA73_07110 [Candidatus Hydrogenedentota bacterium]|nr:MAG: hypothetical protein COA73_07110 [Candidatus Hydrogenedentota bacterium]
MSQWVRYSLLSVLVAGQVFTNPSATAQDAPKPDQVITNMMNLSPAEIAAHLKALKDQENSLRAQAKKLREQAAALDVQDKTIQKSLQSVNGFVKAMAPAPAEPAMVKPAVQTAEKPSFNYIDNILPIFEARCIKCHGNDKREGGLSLATFGHMQTGGSSGEQLIVPGDPDGSRMFQLVLQEMDPVMPPEGKPMSDEQLDLMEAWIESGARSNADAKVKVAKVEKKAPNPVFLAAEIKDGPPPMPEVPLTAYKTSAQRGIAVRAMATSSTAPLLATGGDHQILLYNLDTYKMIGALPFPEGDIYSMTFSFNGELLLVCGGVNGGSAAAVIYDIRKAKRVGSYGKGYDSMLAGDISPDHRMVALGGPDKKVRVYDTNDGALLYEMDKHTDWVQSIRFSPDGELLATSDRGGGLYYWQAANGRFVEPLPGHNSAIHDMAYTYDSNIMATAGEDGTVILWDTWKYRQVRKIRAHNGPVLSVHYNHANELITTGKDGQTLKWGNDGKQISKFPQRPDWAYQSRFAAKDSLVITGDWSGNIVVWNAADTKETATLSTRPTPDMLLASEPTPPASTD